jgi:hypothetical protein
LVLSINILGIRLCIPHQDLLVMQGIRHRRRRCPA